MESVQKDKQYTPKEQNEAKSTVLKIKGGPIFDKLMNTKTETTKIDINNFEDFQNDQLEEKVTGNHDTTQTVGQRSIVCKTLSTIKSRLTFIEGVANNLPPGSSCQIVKSFVFGQNDSKLNPNAHKGSSEIMLALPQFHQKDSDKKSGSKGVEW